MLRISQPRIISFVRLLGKLGIFRPLLEYYSLRRKRRLPSNRPLIIAQGIEDKRAVVNIGAGIPGQGPWTIKFPGGKLFSLPAQIYDKYFLFMESTALPCQSLQCPGPIVPSLYSVRVSVSSLVWLGDK